MTSCYVGKFYGVSYDLSLSEVQKPSVSTMRYDSSTITKNDKMKYSFSDSLIEIKWLIGIKQFDFELKNKTKNTIKVIWDEAVYVDTDGSSSKVMHDGVKYTDRNESQKPTVIAPLSFINDLVLPTKNVYYETNPYMAGWKEKYFLPIVSQDKATLINTANMLIGKKVKIILPIQIKEIVNDYTFTFNINSYTLPTN